MSDPPRHSPRHSPRHLPHQSENSDQDLIRLYRLLDASINRVVEGMRTLEDVSRFVLDDRDLSQSFKSLRHDLQTTLSAVARRECLLSRNTAGDVGTELSEATETIREDLAGIVAAAASRSQQSLRVIEETFKLLGQTVQTDSPSIRYDAAAVERIRYRLYDDSAKLELQFLSRPQSRAYRSRSTRLQTAQVYGLVSAMDDETCFSDHIRRLCKAGVQIIQIRDKRVCDRTLYDRCRIAVEVMRPFDTLLIINDRADLAVAVDADGVHVGQDELPPTAVRTIIGPDRLLGLSTHDLKQSVAAQQEPIDYIGCGPIFKSSTKSFDSHTGTDWLRKVNQQVKLPAFAIGGIDLSNATQIAASGIARVAVSGMLSAEMDLEKTVPRLFDLLSTETV